MDTNQLLPILSYIKIDIKGDKGTLTKNNLKSFVVRKFDAASEDCSFLVVENILSNFIAFSGADEIQFEQTANRIRISDGQNFVESPTDRAIDFPMPEMPKDDLAWSKLDKRAVTAVGICAKIIFDSELLDPKSHVFLGKGFIAATDGMIAYVQAMEEGGPQIIFRKDVGEAVGKITDVEYSCNSSYDFFRQPDAVFGFSKSEINFFDVAKLIPPIADDKIPEFRLDKTQLIKFCGLCISSITTKTTIASAFFKVEDGNFTMGMEESDIKIQSQKILLGKTDPFKFNPASMKTLLENIGEEEVYFYKGEKRYFITDSKKSFLAVIMGII